MADYNQHPFQGHGDGTMSNDGNSFRNDNQVGDYGSMLSNGSAINSYNQSWDSLSHTQNNESKIPFNWQGHQENNQEHSHSIAGFQNNAYMDPNSQYGTDPLQNPGGFRSFPENSFDPSIFSRSNAHHENDILQPQQFDNVSLQPGTIAPEALQSRPSSAKEIVSDQRTLNASSMQKSSIPSTKIELPHGIPKGNFSVIDAESLAQSLDAKRFNDFLLISNEPQEINVAKSALPNYIPRKSRTEIRKLLAKDSKLKEKITKRGPGRPPKEVLARLLSTNATSPTVSSPQQPQSSSSEEDSSEDGSEYTSSEEEEVPKAPIPSTRPTAPLEAAKYDAVKALWRIPNRSVSAEEVRKGLTDFWELIGTIKDRWKSDDKAVKEAEESKKVKDLPLLTERVSNQRSMLSAALRAAIDHGHPDILEPLGAHLQFLASMTQFLQDRSKESDYNGALPVRIFQMLCRCKSATAGDLERTGITKAAAKFAKRGDERIKTLTKRLTDNSIAATKKKTGSLNSNTSNTQDKEVKAAESKPKASTSTVAGVKRPLSVDSNSSQPAKKVASGQTEGSPTQSKNADSTKRIGLSGVSGKAITATTNSVVPVKQKQVTAKSSNFFSSLQPAKKPGTSNAEQTAAQTKSTPQQNKIGTQTSQSLSNQSKTSSQSNGAEKKAAIAKSLAAPNKPAFSIFDTLATIHGPKESEPLAKPDKSSRPEETEEEKAKRLRKEERRKLKVHFKPDDVLVEVHLFSHDPDEELGHDEAQTRDVGDVDSEGRMFKQRQQQLGDMMEIDEEDDEASSKLNDHSEVMRQPTLIDFSNLEDADRDQNYAPYGGGVLVPECPEKTAQEQREANTLAVFYTQSIDVPPSPNEPSGDSMDINVDSKDFGAPPERFVDRIKKFIPSNTASSTNQPQPALDLPALFGIQSQMTQPPMQRQTQPQPAAASSATELEKIFAQFAAPGGQPQQTQPQQAPPTIPPPWGSQPPAPIPNFMQNPTMPTTQIPTGDPLANLSSVLAQLQQQPAAAAPMAPPQGFNIEQMQQDLQMYQTMMSSGIMPGAPGAPPMMGNNNSTAAPPFENEDRRRWREQQGGSEEAGDDVNGFKARQQQQAQQQQKGWAGKKRPPGSEPPKFVVQCKYYKEGKCRKGADCTFRHDD